MRLELTLLLILIVLYVMKSFFFFFLLVTFDRANFQGVNLLPNIYKEKNEGCILYLALAAPIFYTFRRPWLESMTKWYTGTHC